MSAANEASLSNAVLGGISPLQLKMARKALGVSVMEVGPAVGVTGMMISKYERRHHPIPKERAKKLEQWFRDRRVFFGPKDGVCVGSDVFSQERFFSQACFQILVEHGLVPSSTDLIEARRRAMAPNANSSAESAE